MTTQQQAMHVVRQAVIKGRLRSLRANIIPCADCGKRATVYDHRRYSLPLEVQPVCDRCNKRRGRAIDWFSACNELRVRIDAKLLKSVKLAVVQHDTSLPYAVSQALRNWLRGLRPSRQSEENRR